MDETNSDRRNENYNVLKTDPEALLQLLNKYVKVQLIKNTEFFGFVHSIDPVHHSKQSWLTYPPNNIANLIQLKNCSRCSFDTLTMLGSTALNTDYDCSIILLVPEEDSYTVNIIPGHAVLNVAETDTNFKPPGQQSETHTADEIERRKHKLISWFKKNLLPINESGQKILFGNVSILPPYGVSNICTDNTVVAMQLRKMIENMPDNFEWDDELK